MLRIYKIDIFLKSDDNGDDSKVSEKINRIAIELVILLYISSTLFMVLENFNKALATPYRVHTTFYFMVVTLMTIGYGDFFPVTVQGKFFTMFMILYVIVYKIPLYTQELLRLLGLQSFYARTSYVSNGEIPHVVITGQVVF
jgi:hypothetical protein